MTAVGFLRPSPLFLLMILLVCTMTFSMGAVTGAEAATNESVSVDDQLQLVDEVESEVTQDIHENVSDEPGGKTLFAASGGDLLITIPMAAARMGVRWGYNNPQHTELVAANLHVIGLAVVGYYLGGIMQKWRRRR